jgi:DNA/RNA endonuclease YhcR with UshA esterase domain
MHKVILAAAAMVLAVPLFVQAQDAAAPSAPTAPPPATKPATTQPGEVIEVKEAADAEKLKALIGQDASVRGKVVEVFVPRSGSVTIFNFFSGADRRLFNVVVDKANLEAVNEGFNGDVGAAVKDKTIVVTGKVADYRGNPQIKIEKPEQIKVEAEK